MFLTELSEIGWMKGDKSQMDINAQSEEKGYLI